jgi:hypothetical protein
MMNLKAGSGRRWFLNSDLYRKMIETRINSHSVLTNLHQLKENLCIFIRDENNMMNFKYMVDGSDCGIRILWKVARTWWFSCDLTTLFQPQKLDVSKLRLGSRKRLLWTRSPSEEDNIYPIPCFMKADALWLHRRSVGVAQIAASDIWIQYFVACLNLDFLFRETSWVMKGVGTPTEIRACYLHNRGSGIAHSVQRVATAWTEEGSEFESR